MASFFLLLCLLSLPGPTAAQLGMGINYGQMADNLPTPVRVAAMLQSIGVNRVKLYDANPDVLSAFADTGIELIVGLGNEYLYNMTGDISAAAQWVQAQVQPYIARTRITTIAVGNEVLTGNDTRIMALLVPAMQTLHSALSELGLSGQLNVTTANSVAILGDSFPPSSGSFRPDLGGYISQLLNFHSTTNSPFLINAYPFFAYKADPAHVSLDYVLFRANPGLTDPGTGLHYDNMLYAQIDAVYSAIRAMGHADIPVQVSETGWPSRGDSDEAGASPQNAAAYNGNLLQRIQRKEGTPAKPNVPIDVYVFALFNEDQKPGPTSERNYGLFYPNETPVYSIGLQSDNLPEFITTNYSAAPRTKFSLYVGVLLSFITIIASLHIHWGRKKVKL